MELATLGGGCFWCLDALYRTLDGIKTIASGYAGGRTPNPNYKSVCSGATEHAEVVQLNFYPLQISFEQILEVFFAIHDPTTLNRQGNDIGTQYRSIILYHSPEQASTAHSVIARLNQEGHWPNPIVTQVVPFTAFHAAEIEHQDFLRNNPYHPYCQRIIAPKVAELIRKNSSKKPNF